MKIMIRLFLICLFISCIAASYAGNATTSHRGVLYWKMVGNLCEMRIFHPEEKKSIKISEMESNPQQIFFSKKWDKVYYRLYNKLFSLDWKINAAPVHVLTFPDKCLQDQSAQIWLDRETNRWRCVVEEPDLTKYPVIKKDGQHYLQYKNNLVEINNRYNHPEVGIKYLLSVLNVMEYDVKTGWNDIAYVSTNCNASSDPCFESADPYRNPARMTTFDNIVNKTSELSRKSEYSSYPTEAPKWMFDISPESNSFIKVNAQDDLMYPGLSLVDKKTKKETVILNDIENLNLYGFLGLSYYGNYLLITVSHSLNRGVLVDLNSQNIIFTPPEGSPVMWVNIPK